MGMSVGGGGGHRAEINVTPMIDVLLVLIIIFMVITPVAQHGLKTEVPQQSTANEPPAPKGLRRGRTCSHLGSETPNARPDRRYRRR